MLREADLDTGGITVVARYMRDNGFQADEFTRFRRFFHEAAEGKIQVQSIVAEWSRHFPNRTVQDLLTLSEKLVEGFGGGIAKAMVSMANKALQAE